MMDNYNWTITNNGQLQLFLIKFSDSRYLFAQIVSIQKSEITVIEVTAHAFHQLTLEFCKLRKVSTR